MHLSDYVFTLNNCEMLCCLIGLLAITIKKQWSEYWALGALLAVHAVPTLTFLSLNHIGNVLSANLKYQIYFFIYWIGYAVESMLVMMVIYSVFQLAMAPLKGLQTLGTLIFRWAAAISIAVALGSAFAPNLSRTEYLFAVLSQLQRTQSILALSLLLFVCFAIRPMGLSYGSRIFGVGLGLGLVATNDLVQAAWFSPKAAMSTISDFINCAVFCTATLLWIAYFALPEQKRRLVLLPTTSPFHRWNQISLALGDSPGVVALGTVDYDAFAPSELEILRRASRGPGTGSTVAQFPSSVGA